MLTQLSAIIEAVVWTTLAPGDHDTQEYQQDHSPDDGKQDCKVNVHMFGQRRPPAGE